MTRKWIPLLALAALVWALPVPALAARDQVDTRKFQAIVREIDGFWRQTLKSDGARYRTPHTLLVDGVVDTACGPVDPSIVAAYCEGDATIYLAPVPLGALVDSYGDFALVLAVAHEWSHHVQVALGLPDQRTIKEELQADCLAGAAISMAERQGLVQQGDLREAVKMTRDLLGDPDWLPRDAPDAHGSGPQRVKWLTNGYDQGLSACGIDGIASPAALSAQEPPAQSTPEPTPDPATDPAADPAAQQAPAVDPAAASSDPNASVVSVDAAAAATDASADAAADPAAQQDQAPPADQAADAQDGATGETKEQKKQRKQAEKAAQEAGAPADQVPADAAPPAQPADAGDVAAPAGGTVAIQGKFVFVSTALQQTGNGCAGSGLYADVAPGMSVTVLDANGAPVGSTVLGAGIQARDGVSCIYQFTVENLPASPSYDVVLGARNPLRYEQSLLEQAQYRIGMRLQGG